MVDDTSIYLLISAALILLSNVFALRNKRRLNNLEKVGLVAGIVFGAIGAITFFLGNDFVIPFLWRGIILVVGIIAILLSLFAHRVPRISLQSQVQREIRPLEQPRLEFGKLIVRKQSDRGHGGTYNKSIYLIEVINTTPNTVAINCQGSIDVQGSNLGDHVTVWDKNNKIVIPIGHTELLKLFDVSVFNSEESKVPVTTLYFYHDKGLKDTQNILKRYMMNI